MIDFRILLQKGISSNHLAIVQQYKHSLTLLIDWRKISANTDIGDIEMDQLGRKTRKSQHLNKWSLAGL
jgi:hypothetical protein